MTDTRTSNRHPLLVYIAGAYTAPDDWQRALNVARAEALALRVLEAGHHPVCTHTMARHWFGRVPEDVAIAWCDALLRASHVAVFDAGWQQSPGSVREHAICLAEGIIAMDDESVAGPFLGPMLDDHTASIARRPSQFQRGYDTAIADVRRRFGDDLIAVVRSRDARANGGDR